MLAFQHPMAGKQLVKGTVEKGEEIAVAALRELEEESGIKGVRIKAKIGIIDRYAGAGLKEDGPLEQHQWHVFLIDAPEGLPETWTHEVSAGEEEQGLVFDYFWQNIPNGYHEFDSKFVKIFERVEKYLGLR